LQTPTSVTHDGKLLVFRENDPKTGNDLWIMELDGARQSRPAVQSQFSEMNGEISPDGRWLAYRPSGREAGVSCSISRARRS
jgi:Tol biopolymer transport system component